MDNGHDMECALPCWTSRDEWLVAAEEAYLLEYKGMYLRGEVESVSMKSYRAVIGVMADHAEHATGRNVRVTVAEVMEIVGRTKRTVQRARALTVALGVRTVVVPGRYGTPQEQRLVREGGVELTHHWDEVSALHAPRAVIRDGMCDDSEDDRGGLTGKALIGFTGWGGG
jgi:hypothetical protein